MRRSARVRGETSGMGRRLPLVAAIVFAALFTAALAVAPPPGIEQSGTALVSHLGEHAGAIRIQALLATLATLALAIVLGHARDRLDGWTGYLFTIGSAMMLVEISVEFWFSAGLALHARTLEPSTARALADVAAMFGPVLTMADVMVAVPIVLAANGGRFPRWLGVLAAVFAIEQFVEVVTVIGPERSFISPGGPMNMYLGGTLFILFFLGVGIASGLRPKRGPL
jgi:hypothetical protein